MPTMYTIPGCRLTMTVWCNVFLQDFPMDRQRCELRLMTCKYVGESRWGRESPEVTAKWGTSVGSCAPSGCSCQTSTKGTRRPLSVFSMKGDFKRWELLINVWQLQINMRSDLKTAREPLPVSHLCYKCSSYWFQNDNSSVPILKCNMNLLQCTNNLFLFHLFSIMFSMYMLRVVVV